MGGSRSGGHAPLHARTGYAESGRGGSREPGDRGPAQIDASGVHLQGELSIGGSSWVSPKGVTIDVLEGHEEWWPEALQAAQDNRDAQGLPILPLPYLALMKFQAGRLQDLADVSRMLGQASEESLAEVRALFAHYVSAEDLQDLESLITLGKMELKS